MLDLAMVSARGRPCACVVEYSLRRHCRIIAAMCARSTGARRARGDIPAALARSPDYHVHA